jgi:hypothetical protein
MFDCFWRQPRVHTEDETLPLVSSNPPDHFVESVLPNSFVTHYNSAAAKGRNIRNWLFNNPLARGINQRAITAIEYAILSVLFVMGFFSTQYFENSCEVGKRYTESWAMRAYGIGLLAGFLGIPLVQALYICCTKLEQQALSNFFVTNMQLRQASVKVVTDVLFVHNLMAKFKVLQPYEVIFQLLGSYPFFIFLYKRIYAGRNSTLEENEAYSNFRNRMIRFWKKFTRNAMVLTNGVLMPMADALSATSLINQIISELTNMTYNAASDENVSKETSLIVNSIFGGTVFLFVMLLNYGLNANKLEVFHNIMARFKSSVLGFLGIFMPLMNTQVCINKDVIITAPGFRQEGWHYEAGFGILALIFAIITYTQMSHLKNIEEIQRFVFKKLGMSPLAEDKRSNTMRSIINAILSMLEIFMPRKYFYKGDTTACSNIMLT